jgi:hypothetical protein
MGQKPLVDEVVMGPLNLPGSVSTVAQTIA